MCEEDCENCPYSDLDMIPKEVNCRIAKLNQQDLRR